MKNQTEIKNQPLEALQDLLRQMTTDKANKIDYIADATQLEAIYDLGTKTHKLLMRSPEDPDNPKYTFEISDVCHDHIAGKTNIPKQFYDRLRTNHPDLLTSNINTLIHDKNKVMVRTLYGRARALLSNRYQPIDSSDVMNCSLKELDVVSKEQNIRMQIMRADNTDTHFRMKVYSPDYVAKIGEDTVHGGIIISNSEVGYGKYRVQLFIAVIRCNNGLISSKGESRVHLGRSRENGEFDWSSETIELQDATLLSELRDLIRLAFNREKFQTWIDELNDVASTPVPKPIVAIRNISRDYGIAKEEAENLLTKFAEYGYTQWGLSQTVTDYAQTVKNYDHQIELEKAGADIMTRPISVLVKEED